MIDSTCNTVIILAIYYILVYVSGFTFTLSYIIINLAHAGARL